MPGSREETDFKPDLEAKFGQQADEIINRWRTAGIVQLYYDTTRGKMHSKWANGQYKLNIDDPRVREWLINSLERSVKYSEDD